MWPLISQNAWVKRGLDGDTLLLTNEERSRLIEVDIPKDHKSKKLYRNAKRSVRDIRIFKELGEGASAFSKKMVDKRYEVKETRFRA